MSHIDDMYFKSKGFEHYYQNRRRLKVLDGMRRMKPMGIELLDVGCAEGYYIDRAREMGYVAMGVDTKPQAHPLAMVGSALDLPFDDQSFDVVVCSRVLEYVGHPEIAARELKRVARRGIIVTVPLGRSPYVQSTGDVAYPFTVKGVKEMFGTAKVLCPSRIFGRGVPLFDDICEPWCWWGTDIYAEVWL